MSTNRYGWSGAPATKARRILALRMARTRATGQDVICPRCDLPIHPGQAWDVGHQEDVSLRPDLMWQLQLMRPEHSACNRGAGARRTHQIRARKAQREWGWR